MSDTIATRPGVICACGNIVVFARERSGKMDGVICPLCMRFLTRPTTEASIQYKDKTGKMHDLKDTDIIVR